MVAKPQRCKNAWQLCAKALVDPGSSDYIVRCSKDVRLAQVLPAAGSGSIPEETSSVCFGRDARSLRIDDPHVSQTLSLPDELAGPSGPALFSGFPGAKILRRPPLTGQEGKSRNCARFAQPLCKPIRRCYMAAVSRFRVIVQNVP